MGFREWNLVKKIDGRKWSLWATYRTKESALKGLRNAKKSRVGIKTYARIVSNSFKTRKYATYIRHDY